MSLALARQCGICRGRYNKTNRKPKLLQNCRQLTCICVECFDHILISEPDKHKCMCQRIFLKVDYTEAYQKANYCFICNQHYNNVTEGYQCSNRRSYGTCIHADSCDIENMFFRPSLDQIQCAHHTCRSCAEHRTTLGLNWRSCPKCYPADVGVDVVAPPIRRSGELIDMSQGSDSSVPPSPDSDSVVSDTSDESDIC